MFLILDRNTLFIHQNHRSSGRDRSNYCGHPPDFMSLWCIGSVSRNCIHVALHLTNIQVDVKHTSPPYSKKSKLQSLCMVLGCQSSVYINCVFTGFHFLSDTISPNTLTQCCVSNPATPLVQAYIALTQQYSAYK